MVEELIIKQEKQVTPARIRDLDIYALSVVGGIIDSFPGACFVLTGSYAIEALVGSLEFHNDLDTNVFVEDLERDLPRIGRLIEERQYQGIQISPVVAKTTDRLEYDIVSKVSKDSPRRLELQFFEAVPVSTENGIEFSLVKKEEGTVYRIPTIIAPLKDSTGRETLFRIKSLSYAIATWAIRISGLALNPKRLVRRSDIERFKLLLDQKYPYEEVLRAIKEHPQRPGETEESFVFEQALNYLSEERYLAIFS